MSGTNFDTSALDELLGSQDKRDNAEEESRAELNEFQKLAKSDLAREQKAMRDMFDSEYWVALCFDSRAQKEAFLHHFKLFSSGDKYLDGVQVAEALGVSLPDAPEIKGENRINATWLEFTGG